MGTRVYLQKEFAKAIADSVISYQLSSLATNYLHQKIKPLNFDQKIRSQASPF
ncbi:MAG: hypothetical protein AB4080_13020 [Trichodesmium sp.]